MTRIMHILDHSLPLHSGYTFRTRAILKSLQGAGMSVCGITGQRHKDGQQNKVRQQAEIGQLVEEVEGLEFYRTPGEADGPVGVREWREIAALTESIVQVAKQWKPDILHAHSPALCGQAGLRAAKQLGIPLVYEIRAFWEDAAVGNGTGRVGSVKYRMTRLLENRVITGADAIFTICDGLREDLVSRGFDGGKIGISPNGVDLSMFGDPPPRDEALAAKLGINDRPVIGFIGSFYDYEGLGDLIAAMPALQALQPGTQLLLVGGGPMDQALRDQAAASPAGNDIYFTGRVPHSQVDRYYSLVDILAYPRKRSRLTDLVTPLKPLEAMAQRRIVAASDVGGHRELITHGVTGCLFPADDPAGTAEALSELIDRSGEWDAMKARARAHVAMRHDWAKNIHRYQSVYHHLLAKRGDGEMPSAA